MFLYPYFSTFITAQQFTAGAHRAITPMIEQDLKLRHLREHLRTGYLVMLEQSVYV